MTSPLTPFPASRVCLSRQLLEPCFDEPGRNLFVASLADGRMSVGRLALDSGLFEPLTADPQPAGGVAYGGGLFAVRRTLLVYAAGDGRLHRLDLSTGEQRAITPRFDGVGAPVLSSDGRFALCAVEHEGEGFVVLADTAASELPARLPSCLPFCADPALGDDDARCAWQTWPEDRMPWDHAELRVARFARPLARCRTVHDAFPVSTRTLAREGAHLAFPLWLPGGRALVHTSDETGWRTPWLFDPATGRRRALTRLEAEIGSPNWVQRMMPMALGQGGSRLYATARRDGRSSLVAIELRTGAVRRLASAYTSLGPLGSHHAGRGGVDLLAYTAASPTCAPVLVTLPVRALARPGKEQVRMATAVGPCSEDRLRPTEVLEWDTVDGTGIWGILTRASGHAPRPLVVFVHGGPTSAAELTYDPSAQYFATRGYHYLAVNHRGSTGRGRAFQDRLLGNWGVCDVQDARSAAEHLVRLGLADRDRVAIMGGSAGGYTALMAIAADPDTWAAGVAYYGIGDLYETMLGSHRFEKRYQDALVGRLPEAGPTWMARSPLHLARAVRAPLLLLHGAKDKAVPCRQSIDLEQAIRANHGVAELVTYEDEGHGFRQEKNRRDALERTLAFLDRYVRDRQGHRPDAGGGR
jgi:dipeptidyl aminopeptidase/acylaminoacyl peptidase